MKPTIILSGIPGSMTRQIAAVARESAYAGLFDIASSGFSEPAMDGRPVDMGDGLTLLCRTTSAVEALLAEVAPRMPIVVDYTTPGAALANVAVYASAGLPFVMGTTGFDRAQAVELVRASSSSAVIAPNMGVPIVMLQTALSYLAERFPGALKGYSLNITESHQKTKKDVSGTARAFQPLLEGMGMACGEGAIVSIRNDEEQRGRGVPDDFLTGHGWHWYQAVSPAGDVTLELSHRVNGRRVYAEGTLRAVEFLARRIAEGSRGVVYTMEDVLSEGAPEQQGEILSH